jgi:Glycosyltransferase like family
VIAFGSAISGAEAYRRYAEPGVHLASEPDSEIYAFAAVEPIGRTYNLILDAAAGREDLEALVLVHPHTEMVDPEFCAKVRQALAESDVGVVGCTGATEVKSIAWWEGRITSAPVIQRYEEHGGGQLAPASWAHREPPPAEVQALDGQLLVLSPWVVRNVRFDESLLLGHGFDLDFSLQVRAVPRRLMVADLRVVHHRSLELISDLDVWVEAHIRVAEKWNGTLGQADADETAWKLRARRAEARREAARAIAFSKALTLDARVLELERALAEKIDSPSWRLTAPLRTLNRLRREAADRRNDAEHANGTEPPDGTDRWHGAVRGNG